MNVSEAPTRFSELADNLVASEILAIATDVRQRIADGAEIYNLTIGDFRSEQFPIPSLLKESVHRALDEGQTHYPPANGVPECRKAVQHMYREHLGLDYGLESVLVAGGARPVIAGTYLTVVDPGDQVVYPVPSWNNNHYCTLRNAQKVELVTGPETMFFPTVDMIRPHLQTARLICLNTPQNPSGTVMDPDALRDLSEAIVEENLRRQGVGQRPLYLMFDQVYWMLTYGQSKHATPVALVPQMKDYTIFVDGISKGFAATGLRVGWAVAPPDIIDRMAAFLTHIGAWAPRPEQMATATLLTNSGAVQDYRKTMLGEVLARLNVLAEGVQKMKADGIDIEAIDPQGAIYLSMRIGAKGRKTPNGQVLETDEDIRRYILAEAQTALVPFTCFGVGEDTGWFRASVGAVDVEACRAVVGRLGQALKQLH